MKISCSLPSGIKPGDTGLKVQLQIVTLVAIGSGADALPCFVHMCNKPD